MASGRVRAVEQYIIDQLSFVKSLPGQSTVEVSDTVGWYTAKFIMGEETLSKRFETLKPLNDWLLTMSHSFKTGSFSQGVKKAQQSVKGSVQLDIAVQKLEIDKAPKDAANDPLLTLTNSEEKQVGAGAQDITSEFLAVAAAKSEKELLPESSVCVRKDNLSTLCNLAASDHTVCALLLGKNAWNSKLHATQMVLTTGPIESVLQHERVVARCSSSSLVACGAVVVGSKIYPEQHPDLVKDIMGQLNGAAIIIALDYSRVVSGDWYAWELCPESNELRAVSISWVTNPRDRSQRLSYNMCWVEELGVGHVEAATRQIVAALVKQIRGKDDGVRQGQNTGGGGVQFYDKLPVPADGYCGWHSLLAFQADHCSFHTILVILWLSWYMF